MTIKVIHTSDWHLGKKLYKSSRLYEQKLFLDWLIQLITDNRVDALVISGDIFDTPSPPTEALKLYFDFLSNLTSRSDTEIFIISGNHDSGKFLEAPNALLKNNNIHIVGQINPLEENFSLDNFRYTINKDSDGLDLVLLPYFRSYEILNLGKFFNIENSDDNSDNYILTVLEEFFRRLTLDKKINPSLLVAHHLFGNYQTSGSEQGLSLSGLESIPTTFLGKYFEYVALGHIHNPQIIKNESPHIYYSGSPIPFRFSEKTDKSLAILRTENSKIVKEIVSIPKFRKLITVEATYDDYQDKIKKLTQDHHKTQTDLNSLLEVKIKLDDPKHGIADTIRELLKDSPIELLSLHTDFIHETRETARPTLKLSMHSASDLFDLFYKKKFPDSKEIPSEILEDFYELLDHSHVTTSEEL